MRQFFAMSQRESLLEVLREQTALYRKLNHLGVYVSCLSDQDTANDTHQEMSQRFSTMRIEEGRHT